MYNACRSIWTTRRGVTGRRRYTRAGETTTAHQGIQILTVWSTLPLASTLTGLGAGAAPLIVAPLAAGAAAATVVRPQARQVTKCSCASSVLVQRPVLRSQIRIVLSSDAESRKRPDGWKTRARTQLSCPTCAVSAAQRAATHERPQTLAARAVPNADRLVARAGREDDGGRRGRLVPRWRGGLIGLARSASARHAQCRPAREWQRGRQ